MLGLPWFGKKKKQRPAKDIVADEGKQRPSSTRSVAATKCPGSDKKSERKTKKKRSLWKRLFFSHRKKGKKMKESEPEPEDKPRWWRLLFIRSKRRRCDTPAPEKQEVVPFDAVLEESSEPLEESSGLFEKSPELSEGTPDASEGLTEVPEDDIVEEAQERSEQQETSSFSHQDEVVPLHTESDESSKIFNGQPETPEDFSWLPEVTEEDIKVEQAIVEPQEENEQQESSSFSLEDEVVEFDIELDEFLELFEGQPDVPKDDKVVERAVIQGQDDSTETARGGTPKEENEQQEPSSFSHQDEVVPLHTAPEESSELSNTQPETPKDFPWLDEESDDDSMMQQAIIESLTKPEVSTKRSLVRESDDAKQSHATAINCFGFPNIGQSCYMNSILQSLLMLKGFISDFSCQEPVWSSDPEAELLRTFMAITDAHNSTDSEDKRDLLHSFKKAVAAQAPEFSDKKQKDAHEFLTSVLDQMRRLSPFLQHNAASMGRRYTCPVEDHLVFKMENTRTCKRCGAQSKREEEFTNLSLDLVPGGSVEDLLQEYMMETELEYKCECGGNASGQRSAFATLPSALILHLKRFRFTTCFKTVKVHDPVVLLRDIAVSSKEGRGCYSLVSAISHFGSTGGAGHYICDGIHPDNRPDEPTDRWLNFNDSAVTETTGESVCEMRQGTAYILFYKRQV